VGGPSVGARRLRQAGAVREGGAGPGRHRVPPSSTSSTPRSRLLPRRQARTTPLFATALPRSPLVMSAIELGWESSLQVPPPSSPRVQPHSFFLPCSFHALAIRAAVSPSSSRLPSWS
jgi:hypothetical protein